MKKSDLLAIPCQLPTKAMQQAAGNKDLTRFCRAVVCDGILVVSIWIREHVEPSREPDVRIFIDKENGKWLNYMPASGKWGIAQLRNLTIEVSCEKKWTSWEYVESGWRQKWEAPPERKVVNRYFAAEEKSDLSIWDEVRAFEDSIVGDRKKRRTRKILAPIDEQMSRVSDCLPKDFETWAQTDAYSLDQYMIYDHTAGKARCTACWGVVADTEAFRHNQPVTCPICRAKVTCKSWNRQKSLRDWKIVAICQKTKDGDYVFRSFHTCIEYRRDEDYSKEWWIHEDGRILFTEDMVIKGRYVWDRYHQEGPVRWVPEYNKGFYQYRTAADKAILYPRNLDRMFRQIPAFRYLPIKKLFTKRAGCYVEFLNFMRQVKKRPQVEMMIKVGLYRAAYEEGVRIQERKWNRESPWVFLGISKEYFKLAVKEDLGLDSIRILHAATERNIRLTIEQERFFKRYFYRNIQDVFSLGHTQKLYRYLKGLEAEGVQRLGDYLDYVEELRKLGLPLDKDNLFPKNFDARHQDTAEQVRQQEDRIKKMELREKDQYYQQNILPGLLDLYSFENNEMLIRIPTCSSDFREEGRNNHNCVGGYFDRVAKKQSVVVFLRRKEDPEKAFCTVEFAPNGDIRQNRSACNGAAPEEAVKFIEALSKQVKKKLEKKAKEEKAQERMTERQRAAG